MAPSPMPDIEEKAGLRDVVAGEYGAAAGSPPPRRRLLPWLVCLALALLVFAGGRTTVCGRPSVFRQEGPEPHALPDDGRAREERPSPVLEYPKAKHLAVEPTPVAIRQETTTSSATASPTVLECFQVAPPVLTPNGASYQASESDGSEVFLDAGSSVSSESCRVLLMEHTFAWSYGMPFIGKLARTCH